MLPLLLIAAALAVTVFASVQLWRMEARPLQDPTADMPRLYASADAFLHMSLLESFGNVFVEAMASGLPIVGHDTPRLRWIVGERDTLCNTEDLDAVAEALRRALATGRGAQDPRSAEFGWPSIAARYRSFLVELLERRNAA